MMGQQVLHGNHSSSIHKLLLLPNVVVVVVQNNLKMKTQTLFYNFPQDGMSQTQKIT